MKNTFFLLIVGIVIQCIGIGLIIFNISSENKVYLWVGLIFIGLAIILVGLFLNRDKKK